MCIRDSDDDLRLAACRIKADLASDPDRYAILRLEPDAEIRAFPANAFDLSGAVIKVEIPMP